MTPTARRLVIDLLSAAPDLEAPVRDLVRACAVFAIRETSVRVAVVRLSAEGLIASAGRGTYRLGDRAQTLAREVGAWRTAEKRLRAWDGSWVAAQVAPRGAGRARDRALQLTGLRALDPTLLIRPDNLEGSVAGVRARLDALGVQARVCSAADFDPATDAAIRRLWDGKALTAGYRRSRQRLERWMARAGTLEPVVAARESFLLGGEAIRQIIFDPLLPAPFVDPAERRDFIDTMRTFDQVGRAFWLSLFGVRLGAPEWVH